MKTAARKLYHFARRPVCHGIGLIRFLATAGALAGAVAWGVPVLESAGNVMQLSSVHLVLATELHAARAEARRWNIAARFCRSDDALTCNDQGGWEQGWIAFDDRNGNGVRDRDERILRVGAALPAAFALAGDLNGRGVKLCLREPLRPSCRTGELTLTLLSDGSRPRPS